MDIRLAPLTLCIATLALGAAVSCGGGSDSPSSPSPSPAPAPAPAPNPAPVAATITITASGVSPRSVTIPVGGRVTFVNSSTRIRDMSSDPHPAHTDCPAINQAGFLQPNQSGTTGNLTTPRTCGFHDHNNESDTSLQGTIIIQ